MESVQLRGQRDVVRDQRWHRERLLQEVGATRRRVTKKAGGKTYVATPAVIVQLTGGYSYGSQYDENIVQIRKAGSWKLTEVKKKKKDGGGGSGGTGGGSRTGGTLPPPGGSPPSTGGGLTYAGM